MSLRESALIVGGYLGNCVLRRLGGFVCVPIVLNSPFIPQWVEKKINFIDLQT